MPFSEARFAVVLGLCAAGAGCEWVSNDEPTNSTSRHSASVAADIPFDPHILVDQFGYRPQDDKVAVMRDPRIGFDNADRFQPGPRYEVLRADGERVLSAEPVPWQGGAVDPSSGDVGWWLDFSALRHLGSYLVHDRARGVRSAVFRIAPDVYEPVLRSAVRTYFCQRSGYPKRVPWAELCWADDASYLGPHQDGEAHDITDRDNPDLARDVSGGWFDAGDTNKYVTFAVTPVHQLLGGFETNPSAFGDDFGIPESGNGIPDLIDEIRWELDWLRRMQNPNGAVALKVGLTQQAASGGAPSRDRLPRFYVPPCTSAIIAAAGIFAHAATVFSRFKLLPEVAADLRERAELAWRKFHSVPRQTEWDSGEVKSGDADWDAKTQDAETVVAAVYLFALTKEPAYDRYVAAHHRDTQPYSEPGWSRYRPHQGEALLAHARQPSADPSVATSITEDKMRDVAAGNQIYGFQPGDNLYRAYMHPEQFYWGSNQILANYGSSNLDAARLDLDRSAGYLARAAEILHYFHGVNPFTSVYLTNMGRHGATRSLNEVFHSWYWQGTRWDNALESECGPAPGFISGGPNVHAVSDGMQTGLAPPASQPPQKAYRDWNTSWPDSSWVVTEPAIYYQAAYIRLLSAFTQLPIPPPTPRNVWQDKQDERTACA